MSVLATFFLALPAIIFAQADQGAINGQVQDSSGGAVPNAAVTLANLDTGLKQNATTDGNGHYGFPQVKIGRYTVTAAAPGFQTTTQQNIQVNVQSRLSIPLTLQVGQATQTVEVTSAPPLLQTEEASTGQVVSSQAINNTPLNGRNWVYIAQLSSGVAGANGSRGQGTGDFNANGQTSQQNNFILDGVDNNSSAVDFLNGATYGVRPPPDALAEFRLQTGSYSAEFGHSAGAVVNASIKSGTNEVHGSAWEYFRNDYLNAHSWGTLSDQKYRQNQFGGTLGLPIIKNKLFFFGDVEANRIIFGSPGVYTVPTALMRQGNFSELLNPALTGNAAPTQLYAPGSAGNTVLPNNVLAASQINPVAQRILSLYPLPNYNGGSTVNNYQVNRNITDNIFQFDTRVDYNIRANDQAFIRYSNSNEPANRPSPLGSVLDGGSYGDDGLSRFVNQNGAFSETHVFTPTLSNEFRIGYNYGHYSFIQNNANTDVSSALGLGGIPFQPLQGGIPNISISGINSVGAPQYYPSIEYQNVLQILDNVSKIAGNHTIRMGVNFQRINFYALQPPSPRGFYTYNGQYTSRPGQENTGFGAADFLADQMQNANITNVQGANDQRWIRAGYVQDDWKASSKLTLNLGVRYEYQAPITEWYGHQALFTPTGPAAPGSGQGLYVLPDSQQGLALPQNFLNSLASNNLQLQYSTNHALVSTQRLNFAPRFGLAYQVAPKTVIRAGYGIFYGGVANVGLANNLQQNFPFNFQSNFPAPDCSVGNCPTNGLTLANGFSAQLASGGLINNVTQPGLAGSDSRPRTPYTQSYNFTVEHSFTNNLAASLGYVGSLGRHLTDFLDPNAAAGIATNTLNVQQFRPFPDFGGSNYNGFDGISNYNSLQARLEQRFSNGLYFLATYTWSHSLDNVRSSLDNGDGGYRNTNIFPIGDEYSNSLFDVRQRFTFNGNYELPMGKGKRFLNRGGWEQYVAGGWSMSATFQAQTGNPFSVRPGSNYVAPTGTANTFAFPGADPFTAGGAAPASNPGVTCAAETKTPTNWFNPCAFGNPLSGNLIPLGTVITDPSQAALYFGGIRNSVYGPGYARMNVSLFKNFPIYERFNVQLRADAFNIANTPAYGQPSITAINSNGGQITGTRFFQNNTPDARFFQISAKVIF